MVKWLLLGLLFIMMLLLPAVLFICLANLLILLLVVLYALRAADFIFLNDFDLKMFRGNNELEGGIF